MDPPVASRGPEGNRSNRGLSISKAGRVTFSNNWQPTSNSQSQGLPKTRAEQQWQGHEGRGVPTCLAAFLGAAPAGSLWHGDALSSTCPAKGGRKT